MTSSYTLKRGFSINWDEAREKWVNESITDHMLFDKIVALYPPALNYLTPSNLRALLKIGPISLANNTLSFIKPEMKSDNPYYIAAWKLYCNQKIVDGKFGGDSSKISFDRVTVDKFNLFLWASLYAFNMTEVPHSSSKFEDALGDDLARLVAYSMNNNNIKEHIPDLYSNLFAPFLRVGKNGIPYDVGLYIAMSRYPPHPDWPETIQNLSHLWNNNATSLMIDTLNDSEAEFWNAFCSSTFLTNQQKDQGKIHYKC